MTNTVGIGVSAELDTSGVEQKINALGQKIAQANRVQFTPVSKQSVADLDKVLKTFEQIRKLPALNARMKATGQANAGLLDVDWVKLYPQQAARAKAMQTAFTQSGLGAMFGAPVAPAPTPAPPAPPGKPPGGKKPPPAPPAPPPPAPGPTWGGIGANVAQTGLRAMGPAGGVAANALGTGMSAGAGAGLMGLVGGLAALAVGKIVSGIAERVETAENNAVAYDRLKRVLGDVNVSFEGLKSVVTSSGDNLKITYQEAGRLGEQFARLGNMQGDQYKTLGGELGVGVGLSRSFGMDPSAGVGVMGQMRGAGVTTSLQESRRFALLIGETIGKSSAFAKAGEVMEAVANYAANQTHSDLGPANVGAYAGMYSGMVGSGIPGMDTQNASALLARVNSTLSTGGAKGEASQFFTGMVGQRMGLDPMQTQLLREGGAFSTIDSTFGEGSIAERFGMRGPGSGKNGAGGSKTFLSASLDLLKEQYGSDPFQLAQATGNHLGVSMRQAAALHLIKPNQMGEMEKFADLTKLSDTGIGNVSKALYGSAQERQSLAGSLLGRTGADKLSSDDAKSITDARGNDGQLREVLAKMAAKYGQESTDGQIIRDQKALLDNIKTALADKLVPIAQDMRAGILWLAGDRKQTQAEVLTDIAKKEHETRVKSIEGEAQNQRETTNEEFHKKIAAVAPTAPGGMMGEKWWQDATKKIDSGTITPKEKSEFDERVSQYQASRAHGAPVPAAKIAEANKVYADSRGAIKGINEAEAARMKAEKDRFAKELESIRANEAARLAVEDAGKGENKPVNAASPVAGTDAAKSARSFATGAGVNPSNVKGGRGRDNPPGVVPRSVKEAEFEQDADAEKLTDDEKKLSKSIYSQESGFGSNPVTSKDGAMGHMQMLPDTFNRFADKGWDINNPSHNRRAAMRYVHYLMEKSGGDTYRAAGGYYSGEKAMRKDGSLADWHDPKHPEYPTTHQYADAITKRMARMGEAPAELPDEMKQPESPARVALPKDAAPAAPRQGTPMPVDEARASREDAADGPSKSSAPAQPGGELQVRIELTAEAQRLIRQQQAPLYTRFGPPGSPMVTRN